MKLFSEAMNLCLAYKIEVVSECDPEIHDNVGNA